MQQTIINILKPFAKKMDYFIKLIKGNTGKSYNPALANVRMPLIIGFTAILIFTFVTIIWGIFAPINSAVIARGSIILLSNKKTIQHLEGGIIEELLVKDGDFVKEGDVLIRLNNVAALASRDVLLSRLYVAQAELAVLTAMRDGADRVSFSDDMIKKGNYDKDMEKVISSQTALFHKRVEVQDSNLESLRQKAAHAEEQIEGLKVQKDSHSESLSLLKEHIKNVKELVKKGYDTKVRLLQLQKEEKNLEGNLGQYDAQIAQVQQTITEIRMSIKNQESDYEIKISDGLHELQSKISDITEQLNTVTDINLRTTITTPVSGVVNALKFHTVGGVIASGSPIMEIIPQDDQLIIEAHVSPSDIDVTHAGLDVNVLFTAYKSRNTPKVPGKIINVSADKVTDMYKNPTESYYLARVQVDKNFLENMKNKIELYPGMPVDTLILTGTRSFLSYLFNPISNSMQRAFREE
ncbi:MAG: hypothetical protein COV35_05870 [Alphaproteobacteria bacterium CG11_big_fil_rev_8_21_14_0_20_39_49]|nr:MAG: hypothetical protein COV35_05870 [Alphaproteobacteria bacterium CG11_big_fil_rev_8_21_14_0_20_39_49]